MVKKILGWVILVLLMAYVVSAAIWARARAAEDSCKGIDIEIVEGHTADSVSRRGVMAEINGYPGKILGEQITAVNTKKIENYLKSFPQFEDVVCSFNTDGRLKVKVTPMVPELRIFEDTVSYYINKDGKRMNSKASFFVDVPVATGKFNSKFKPSDILPMTRFIAKDPVLSRLISMVHAENADNIILIPRIQGHVINFGDTSRLEEKRRALMGMYRQVLPYKGWEEYDTISVKFKGQVVATRRIKVKTENPVVEYEEKDMEEATLPELGYNEIQN